MSNFEFLRGAAAQPDLGDHIPAEARLVFSRAMGEFVMADAHGFWQEPLSGDGHCDPAVFATTIALRLSALSDLYDPKQSQSPIEDMLGAALLWCKADWADYPQVDLLSGPCALNTRKEGLVYYLTPQAKVGGHKVDFLLWMAERGNVVGVAIECDGHAFHERTKEQAARDKGRDRDFLLAGFPVMRFTGSEIFHNPLGCVEQVREALVLMLRRLEAMAA